MAYVTYQIYLNMF